MKKFPWKTAKSSSFSFNLGLILAFESAKCYNDVYNLFQSWGGKDNGFGLAACCEDKPLSEFPPTATTLHYEFYILGSNGASSHKIIHKEHLDTYSERLVWWMIQADRKQQYLLILVRSILYMQICLHIGSRNGSCFHFKISSTTLAVLLCKTSSYIQLCEDNGGLGNEFSSSDG